MIADFIELVEAEEASNCDVQIIIDTPGFSSDNLDDRSKQFHADYSSKEDDFITYSDETSITVILNGDTTNEKIRNEGAKVWSELAKKGIKLFVHGESSPTFNFIEGFLLSSYTFSKYLTEKPKNKIKSLSVSSLDANQLQELRNIHNVISWSRDMVNEPVSFLNAEQFAEEMEVMAKKVGVTSTILQKSQIEALKMGGLLSVNQGSMDPPTFTILEFKPDNAKNTKPIVLVGKGVVYDTGGLSLKPTPNSMDIMKSDMGGAACMAGSIFLCAAQKLPIHVICIIPATDNRPGLNAVAPGDIVKMYNGKTVEVLNTDAEGRMILADALSYAEKYDPELVIDAATLTGAAHRALGDKASIIMGNAQDEIFSKLEKAGDAVHERVVRFPFWDDFLEDMKSPIADLKNLGGPTAGMITAGKFLEQFVDSPYVHMDIAGPAWRDKQKGYITAGGSGVGVRLLYEFLKNY